MKSIRKTIKIGLLSSIVAFAGCGKNENEYQDYTINVDDIAYKVGKDENNIIVREDNPPYRIWYDNGADGELDGLLIGNESSKISLTEKENSLLFRKSREYYKNKIYPNLKR